jgi:hypothetical protein
MFSNRVATGKAEPYRTSGGKAPKRQRSLQVLEKQTMMTGAWISLMS